MNIYVDESGSFVWHPKSDSWSVVVAVAAPEASRRDIATALRRLRQSCGIHKGEIKLPQLGEAKYVQFLDELAGIDIAVFATATDSGINAPELVESHRAAQVKNTRDNIPRMLYEGGRLGVALLADQLESLPNQLYVQLFCQINVLQDVIERGINYYVQRHPSTLRKVRWRIDQKNTAKTPFEEAFEKITPPLMQSRSIREPFMRVRGFDYSHFEDYEFKEGEAPDYLQKDFGLPPMRGFNVQKLVRGDLRFVDSKSCDGVQIADLIASGLRRVLKRAFDDPLKVAERLGRLTVQNKKGRQSIGLISFGPDQAVSASTKEIVQCIDDNGKPFISKRRVKVGHW